MFDVEGAGTGWSRTGSISGYSASGRCSGSYWAGDSGQEYWADEDAISDLIAIKRVDSKDIVYEGKKKATKVKLGREYICVLYLFVVSSSVNM